MRRHVVRRLGQISLPEDSVGNGTEVLLCRSDQGANNEKWGWMKGGQGTDNVGA